MQIQDLIDAQEPRRRKTGSNKVEDQVVINKELTNLWKLNDEREWNLALQRYWIFVKPANIRLEQEMENLNTNDIKEMTGEEFYNFLHDKYFVWKFTSYLSVIQGYLESYQNESRISDLELIKNKLFTFDVEDTKQGLEIASSIHGLGIAGASGLLSLLFPKNFGTVDQFVVKALVSIEGIKENNILQSINPSSINLPDGIKLIKIMIEKSKTINAINKTDHWTPRHIDKVLWTYGR